MWFIFDTLSVLNWAIGRIGIIKGNISAFTGQTLLSIAAPMPRLPPVKKNCVYPYQLTPKPGEY
ncbi:hypothetical protein [Microcoleus sp. N9_B4]|uniref:hypothetical protein n=1 Tax=Microcoleus sp. N9_B4 TaxID=3055386 RepID=UPI002FD39F6E